MMAAFTLPYEERSRRGEVKRELCANGITAFLIKDERDGVTYTVLEEDVIQKWD